MKASKMILLSVLIFTLASFSSISTLILLILLIIVYDLVMNDHCKAKVAKAHLIDFISSCPKPPVDNIPKWLIYPEYEKVRFINHIISILWNPHLKMSIEEKITRKLKWRIEVLKTKYKMSSCRLKKLDFGTSPPIISCVKTSEIRCDMCAMHIVHDQKDCDQKYCALELDIIFKSDDMLFEMAGTYKKISFSVTLDKVSLSGSVMLKLFDFVNVIPGFSRYSVSFINYPLFDFGLMFKSGSLRTSYLPKLTKIIEPFLKKTIWRSIIYPNSKSLSLSTRRIAEMRTAGKLIKYGQRSRETEGSLVVTLKEVKWDHTKETDYAVPSMITGKVNYYHDDLGYHWHCVASIKGTQAIYKTKQIQSKYTPRELKWFETFSFMNFTLSDTSMHNDALLDIDVRFMGKKWDELLGQSSINIRQLIEKNGYSASDCSVDVVKFFNSGDMGWRKVATMVLDITYIPPTDIKFQEKENKKLASLLRESITSLNYDIIKKNLKSKRSKSSIRIKKDSSKLKRNNKTLKE